MKHDFLCFFALNYRLSLSSSSAWTQGSGSEASPVALRSVCVRFRFINVLSKRSDGCKHAAAQPSLLVPPAADIMSCASLHSKSSFKWDYLSMGLLHGVTRTHTCLNTYRSCLGERFLSSCYGRKCRHICFLTPETGQHRPHDPSLDVTETLLRYRDWFSPRRK